MFVEEFIHNYDKDSDKGYILEVDAKYLKKLHRLHSNFLFLLDKLKIENCDKLKYNLQWQQGFPRTKKTMNEAMNHGLKLKKVHMLIKLSQKCWLKTFIDMNTKLRTKTKKKIKKNFFNLMNNSVFWKTKENLRKQWDNNLLIDKVIISCQLSHTKYHTKKWFSNEENRNKNEQANFNSGNQEDSDI